MLYYGIRKLQVSLCVCHKTGQLRWESESMGAGELIKEQYLCLKVV